MSRLRRIVCWLLTVDGIVMLGAIVAREWTTHRLPETVVLVSLVAIVALPVLFLALLAIDAVERHQETERWTR